VAKLPLGTAIAVRVNPREPEISIVCDEDQTPGQPGIEQDGAG